MSGNDQQDAANVLADAVLLGDEPTPQQIALGDAVAQHIAEREAAKEVHDDADR
jgi:hypothetical protein